MNEREAEKKCRFSKYIFFNDTYRGNSPLKVV